MPLERKEFEGISGKDEICSIQPYEVLQIMDPDPDSPEQEDEDIIYNILQKILSFLFGWLTKNNK